MITQPNEIAENFADHYGKISRDSNIPVKSSIRKHRKRKKRDAQLHNKQFTDTELKKATLHLQNL